MTLLAGHITPEEAETSDPTLGVEFEPEHNQVVVYIDEGHSQTEVSLTYRQVCQLQGMVAQARSAMEWHNATWVSASERYKVPCIEHLMKKGEHDPKGKTLCGRVPSEFDLLIGGWQLYPIRGEPSRTLRDKFTGGTCKQCLKRYDKAMQG